MAAVKNQPTSVDKLKTYESQLSTIFGFIIVVAIGVGLLFLLRKSTMTPTPKISDLGGQTAEDLMNANKSNSGKYTVKAGDNLWKIAQSELKDGYQWPTVAKANGIKAPYVVSEGLELTIPTPDPEIKSPVAMADTTATMTPAPATTEPTAMPQATVAPVATMAPASQGSLTPSNPSHTVASGENLWKIAVSEYGDGYKWVQIYKANKDLIGSNPGIIISGQKLNLPDLK